MDSNNGKYITQKHKLPLEDGGELVYVATIPHDGEMPKMSEFYEKLEDSCRRFCAEALPRSLPDGSHSYRYRLTCSAETSEGALTVSLAVTLTDRASRTILSSYKETHVWKDDMIRKRLSDKR